MYCFDTDVLSRAMRRDPPLGLLRRLATVAPSQQFTTSITVGEMLYGALRTGKAALLDAVRSVFAAQNILAFDSLAAERYAQIRTELEAAGRALSEPDLRIAAIASSRDLTLVTGNVKHFSPVPGLRVEDWLTA